MNRTSPLFSPFSFPPSYFSSPPPLHLVPPCLSLRPCDKSDALSPLQGDWQLSSSAVIIGEVEIGDLLIDHILVTRIDSMDMFYNEGEEEGKKKERGGGGEKRRKGG